MYNSTMRPTVEINSKAYTKIDRKRKSQTGILKLSIELPPSKPNFIRYNPLKKQKPNLMKQSCTLSHSSNSKHDPTKIEY